VILDARVDGQAHRVEVTGSKGRYTVVVDGRTLDVDWRAAGGPFASLLVGGRSHTVGLEPRTGGYRVLVGSDEFVVDLLETTSADAGAVQRAPSGPARLVAPMPGRIVRVLAEPGQQVEAGQGLVVMEAMKMENELRAPRAGRVAEVHARERQTVETGALLVVVE
jgi:acetyl/propionyl-CoA carboxylase alpha subunit